ncbi:putative sucrose phosphorylase [Prochlorococcus sp. MIT 0601]|nr:putative sucrose phosphorylase [Prochlorococcus sp. MIT 0601]
MWSQLLQILNEDGCRDIASEKKAELWDSSTAVLITYADGIYQQGEPSLKTLKKLIDNYLTDLSSVIHILPFLCSTSDGGFAVSDYEKLEPRFGGWEDLNDLSKEHILMADLVLNHVSSSHPWVQQFIKSKEPGSKYIFSPQHSDDWSNVIRPRSSSLFTSLATINGTKEVWTTFGPDQIDVNWKEPYIVIEFLKLIIRYIKSGIKWIRLDAVGYIWKESGTTCLHRTQVHQLVRSLRIEMEQIFSEGVLITETNVPEKENISYLQSGDEAHLAYNFPLPPLLLEALISNKCDLLNNWLCSWPELPKNTGFLNFTSSHDGIGLRPLEGLMDKNRMRNLLIACENRGGLISHRRLSNGEDKPYELNISWWSAMKNDGRDSSLFQFERFILSQLFVMSLKGVPAFYLQALMASENDLKTFTKSGERRDLNRERFEASTLFNKLEDEQSLPSRNLKLLKKAMNLRRELRSFHPDQPMKCVTKNRSDLVILFRGEGRDTLMAIYNMTNAKLCYSLSNILRVEGKFISSWKDCLNNFKSHQNRIELSPYSAHWLIPLF